MSGPKPAPLFHRRTMKPRRRSEPPSTSQRELAAPPVRLHALLRDPESLRRRPRLPEHVNRHSAARVPIAADPQPLRLHLGGEALADPDRHILMEGTVISERAEEQLQALALDDGVARRII